MIVKNKNTPFYINFRLCWGVAVRGVSTGGVVVMGVVAMW